MEYNNLGDPRNIYTQFGRAASELLRPYPKYHNKLLDCTRAFRDIIRGYSRPSDCWKFLETGSFKEVYVPFHKAPFVIKFTATDNQTAAEEDVIYQARGWGLENFFVSTYFIPFGDLVLPAEYLEGVYDGYSSATLATPNKYTYDGGYGLNGVELQPRIRVFHGYDTIDRRAINTMALGWEDVNGEPYDNIVLDELSCYIPYTEWLRTLYQYYSNDVIADLLAFMNATGLSDLHSTNLGFSREDGRPLILDWMSASN